MKKETLLSQSAALEEEPDQARLERLRKVHETLKSGNVGLEKEQHQILRTLYHDVQSLDFIPKRLWTRVDDMLRLKIIPKDKKLIERKTLSPQCYVILTGKFEVVTKKRDEGDEQPGQYLLPGSTCGNFQAFNDKRWKAADVVAVEDGSAAEFSSDDLAKLILEENSNSQFKSLISFLQGSIPKFELLSRHSQERLGRFFKERVFMPGQEIVKEGAVPESAFLIREGVCNITSGKSPLIHARLYDTDKVSLKVDRRPVVVQPKKMAGYMSRSTSTYQFSTASCKDWVGDDTILDIESFGYSVIARTKVMALEISKESLKKFPAEIMNNFIENAKKKSQIQNLRRAQLEKNLTNIYNMNPNFHEDHTKSQKETPILAYSPPKMCRGRCVNSLHKSVENNKASMSLARCSPITKISKRATQSYFSVNGFSPSKRNDFAQMKSCDSAADLTAIFQPQKVILNVASLLRPQGAGKTLLPALYKKPVITGKNNLSRLFMDTAAQLDDSKTATPERYFKGYSLNSGFKKLRSISTMGGEKLDTPNPAAVWMKWKSTMSSTQFKQRQR